MTHGGDREIKYWRLSSSSFYLTFFPSTFLSPSFSIFRCSCTSIYLHRQSATDTGQTQPLPKACTSHQSIHTHHHHHQCLPRDFPSLSVCLSPLYDRLPSRGEVEGQRGEGESASKLGLNEGNLASHEGKLRWYSHHHHHAQSSSSPLS